MGNSLINKLHRRLTLVNVAVILLLFFILIVGAYFFFQHDMNRRTDAVAARLEADIKAGIITDLPQFKGPRKRPSPAAPPSFPPGPPPPAHNFFFVKTSPAGAITFQSSGQTLEGDHLAALAAAALAGENSKGTVSLEQNRYTYYKSPLASESGTLIIFHDMEHDLGLLRLLLTALTVVGAICALLSFAASHFMARRAMVPIRTAWRQQSDFLSDASHELRTPLAVIQTNLDIVLDNGGETVASQNKWLTNIREETVHMAKLVDSLLFLARADSNQQPLDIRPFPLGTALVRAVTPFEPLAAAKGITLEYAAARSISGYGDEARIKQVVGILLDNAIRHTPPGGEIKVELDRAGPKTVLTVADNGEGIAPEYHDKIFDRFFQADRSRNDSGAGLGLAIARWIVESHGGTIAVKSAPGKGTTFVVALPWK
ncbi:sensor histidine kinase [Anaeroselena agilis]|uniref:histidine kinase n=1 Tax=Anaeroselena agilis TaxID=3063788 RepID=A0ABU3NYL9_9FIRM|nr:HAMP domain-containing sensor histidine kinase [Selenomonadales bacterium 4137-cl]